MTKNPDKYYMSDGKGHLFLVSKTNVVDALNAYINHFIIKRKINKSQLGKDICVDSFGFVNPNHADAKEVYTVKNIIARVGL